MLTGEEEIEAVDGGGVRAQTLILIAVVLISDACVAVGVAMSGREGWLAEEDSVANGVITNKLVGTALFLSR